MIAQAILVDEEDYYTIIDFLIEAPQYISNCKGDGVHLACIEYLITFSWNAGVSLLS